MKKKERFHFFLDYFLDSQPDATTELHYKDPYQLMVAVILSAQCTDKRVNIITPGFFRSFPGPEDLAKAPPEEVYEIIKSCSYPNNKTKNLIGMARSLVHDFNGTVPDDIDQLQKIPGIGRKSANVIASVVYKKPAMAVDTHVFRVSERIGLTTGAKTPLAAEHQLVKYIPKKYIPLAHHWLILHGRYTCTARNPRCQECGLKKICKYFQKTSV